jgi:NitT/TauT family transport system substrate-binding protein
MAALAHRLLALESSRSRQRRAFQAAVGHCSGSRHVTAHRPRRAFVFTPNPTETHLLHAQSLLPFPKLARASRTLAFGLLALGAWPALAQDKVTFLTSWFAQAEHGGFYQAVATGLYKKHGLDVTVKMGGPQINGMQLLAAGQADFIMGYDLQVMKAVEQGIPVTTVATSFQKDLQGMLVHDDVKGLADLKGKTILIASTSNVTFWPWLKAKYGYSDSQLKPYTFNLQPFINDPNAAQQAYPSSEPFQAQKAGVKASFHLFADEGYPPYGTTIVAMQKTVTDKPDLVARFVKASLEGWKSYLANPAPANELIKRDNPRMDDEQIAFAIKRMKELKVFDGGDAARLGVGVITEARWKATYDFMVQAGLLKPETEWKKAFTTQFTKDLRLMP